MPTDIYTKVKHTDYLKLIERNKALEAEVAELRAKVKKLTAKPEKTAETKTETKKGGNK